MLSSKAVWDSEPWAPFAPLNDDLVVDTCVVGLGGTGLACLKELTELGIDVAGVDGGALGGGAAGRNGGFLLAGTPSFHHDAVTLHGRNRAARLYRLSLLELDRIFEETPEAARATGSLRIASDDLELHDCRIQWSAMRSDGLPVETYDGPEGSGLLFPHDGVMDPLKRCRLLARGAHAGGARLFEHSPVRAISGNEIRTDGGRIRCRVAVVAVDGNLEKLLPELRGRVRTARLQMLASAPAPEVRFTRPVYRRWGYDYWQQLPDGRVALGGQRDRWEEGEWTDRAEPTAPVQQGLEQMLREVLGVKAAVTHRWAGLVGYTATGLPFVGQVRPGVWAVGGYCGTGNVLGSICGRGMARWTSMGETELLRDLLL